MSTPTSAPDRANPETSGHSLIRRVRHELVLRDLAVVSTERISDGLHAIKVGGPALARFTSLSFDDHVKLFFDDAKGQAQRRDYTPVRFDEDRNELTLIFAVHDGGAASDWALRLQPGDAVKIGGPRGSMIIPENLGWYLLAGDLTAWPAMERRLQELPEGTPTVVILQSKDASDLTALPQRPNMVARHVRTGSEMLQVAGEIPLPTGGAAGDGFAWCAGEASAMAKLREVLINERGLPRTHVKASAYWKPGAEGFHETLS